MTKGHIYILADYNLLDTYKIGYTERDIQERLKELNQSPGAAVKLLYLSPAVTGFKTIEKKLHKFFGRYKTYHGENLALREWFLLEPPVLCTLANILEYEFPGTRPLHMLECLPKGVLQQ
jgi:hypothetical protein